MDIPLWPDELEAAARQKLSPAAFDYYRWGAEAETTVAANIEGWRRWHFRPRVCVDVSSLTTAATVLGTTVALPVLLAPTGFNKLADPDGESTVAKAAAKAETITIVSNQAWESLDDIASASEAPKWFQLYPDPDSSITDQRLKRAEELGFKAVVVTVDVPAFGVRYKGIPSMDDFYAQLRDEDMRPVVVVPSVLDWKEIERICSLSSLPVVLKGILHPDDAVEAVRHGAAGIVVSNHGGRQLDGSIPTALALPDIVRATAGHIEIYVDGGIRWGTDVLRALALGARAVLIGRPYLWALAVAGESGVTQLLDKMKAEIHNAMALAGQLDAANVDRDLVVQI